MKLSEHLVLAVLLAPTAALAAAVVIALAGHSDVPAGPGIKPTNLAAFYADMEGQP